MSTSTGSKSRSSSAESRASQRCPHVPSALTSIASSRPPFGELVFGAVGAVDPSDRPNVDESLEPFGRDGTGHSGNAPADIVEAPAATQDFPYDQKGPSTAQHFMGARYGAELPISCHARQSITAGQPVRYGFWT